MINLLITQSSEVLGHADGKENESLSFGLPVLKLESAVLDLGGQRQESHHQHEGGFLGCP